MPEFICMAVLTSETATMCVALLAWVGATVWLLNNTARTERGLWEIRRGRGISASKTRQLR